jgi:hypothetical protein
VIRAILQREASGLPLNHVAVFREDRHLHADILRLFGQWDVAMKAAGIEPARVRRHRRWSRAAVIKRIRQLSAEGHVLTCGVLQKIEATLPSAAYRYFATWDDALAAAGIDPALWRRRVPTWTRERVIAAIHVIRDRGGRLNHAAVGRSSMSRAAVLLFGCWDAALRAAGLDPGAVRRWRKPWTADELIAELQRKHKAGEALNARDVSPTMLRRAADRLFGSWDSALAAAGLDPARIRKNRWRCRR